MKLSSLRIITNGIKNLVPFYEKTTGLTAKWYTDDFAEITTDGSNLAIASTRTLSLFGNDFAEAANNKSVIIEFRVADVDDQYAKIKDFLNDVIQEPTTMPWGNRSLLFRDPEGNLVNFFTPVSAEAVERFS
ncbi:VOC family protein [Mucilaginibacter sp. SG564]|uniref:VOC family protein n=1 Tax=unclassified Mucilaginibacter TaxID=2617802 RepID=UPI001553049D|nr:VOC family protein [Mucilaginibacter sp. SG564]NOW96762.1 putative enzyme related to lactoylglutathione lyase [Mucilaginibacter sp. SG564]